MIKTDQKTLGALIAARRRAAKLSQTQLAKRANTTQQIISQLERGILSDVAMQSYGHVLIEVDRVLNASKINPNTYALWRELLLKELTWQLKNESTKYTVFSGGLMTRDLHDSGATEDDIVKLLRVFAAEGLIRIIEVTDCRAWVLKWTL